MPTTPKTGLRYPSTSDSPNGPLQIANLASDLDSRVFPSPRPFIDCYLRRSDGTNAINPITAPNATYGVGYTDLKVYPITGSVAGTWDTVYSGRGLANTTPGWWQIQGLLATDYTGARYVSLSVFGTENRLVGVDTSAQSGFGAASGNVGIYAPNGLQMLFEAYSNTSASVSLRTSTGSGGTTGTPLSVVRVIYDGPI